MRNYLTLLICIFLTPLWGQEQFRIPVADDDLLICGNPYRIDPSFIAGTGRHTGIDYCTNSTGTVYALASASGIVVFTQQMFDDNVSDGCGDTSDHGMGNNVIIEHKMADGTYMRTSYSHLEEFFVSQEDVVYKGQPIGIMGRSGEGSANHWDTKHIHFETRISNFACNMPGSNLDGELRWGYTGSSAEEPDDFGYVNPTNYLEATNNGTAERVTTTPVPSLPTQDQVIDFFTDEINFDFGTVANAEEYRIQVIKTNASSPYWTAADGFTADTNCGGQIVVNTNTGSDSGFSWNPSSLGAGVCEIPLAGEHYAYTVRSYNSQNFVSTYSVPILFYILPASCQDNLNDQAANNFVNESCMNLRVIEEHANTTNVAVNGQIEFDFVQELMGDTPNAITSNAVAYLSDSPNDYTANDMVASFSATLSSSSNMATHSQTVNAPSTTGNYFLHLLGDADNQHDEFVEDLDNHAVISISVSENAANGCFPIENFRLGGYNATLGQQLLWDASPTGESYDLFVRQVGGSSWSVITPSFDNPGWYAYYLGQPGWDYEAYVRTSCINGDAVNSSTVYFTMPGDVCELTGLNTSSLDYNSTWVVWAPLAAGAGYTITLFDAQGNELDVNQTTNTTTYFGGLTPNTFYSVRVRGECPSGTLLVSATIDFTTDDYACGPITNLTGTATSFDATFSWDEAAGNIYEYEYTYLRSNGTSGSGETFNTTASVSISSGQTVTFTVIADCGANYNSDPASFTVEAPPLTCNAVQNLAVVASTSSSLVFGWNEENEAFYYNYAFKLNGSIIESGTVENTTITFSGLSPLTTYEIEISPYCGELGPTTSTVASTQAGGGANSDEFTVIIDGGAESLQLRGVDFANNQLCAVGSDNVYFLSSETGNVLSSLQLSFPQGSVKLEKVISTSDGNYAAVGDVQITGTTGDTPAVIKFNSQGAVLWSKYLSGGANDDEAEDIIEDANGNLVITGGHRSFGAFSRDMFVIKLSATGDMIFQKAFGGILNNRGFAIELANSGDYYIVGRGYDDTGVSSNDGIPIVKLTPSGNTVWAKILLSTSSDLDGYGTAVDDADNIYFVGEYNPHAIFGKLDANGNLVYSKSIAGPLSKDDLHEIAIDGNDAFLVGRSDVTNNDDKFAIHRFSTSGIHQSSLYLGGDDNIWSNCIVLDGQYLYSVGNADAFSDNSNLNGIVVKRDIALDGDCYSLPYTPTVQNYPLIVLDFPSFTAPSYTPVDANITSDVFEINAIDLCGISCPVALASVDQTEGCVNEDFNFTFTGSGEEEINWSSSAGTTQSGNTANFSFSMPGVYSITVVASTADCAETYSLDVTVVDDPALTTTFVNPNCPEANTGLIEVQTAPSNSIEWSTGDTEATIANLTAGSYTVTVTNSLGCTAIEYVDLIDEGVLPTASFSTQATGDRSYSFTSTISDATLILWDFGDGTSSTMSNPSHNYATGGSYTVVLTATNGCGSVTASETIVLNCPDPDIQIASTTVCPQEQVLFMSTGVEGSTIQWRVFETGEIGSGNDFSTSFSEAGTYTVSLTATTDNCSRSVALTMTIANLPVLDLLVTDPSCSNIADGQIDAQASGGATPYDFNWSNGSTSSSIQNLTAGSYSVTVTDDNNCSAASSTTLASVEDPPIAGFSYVVDGMEVSFQNVSQHADSYSWDFDNGESSTSENPIHIYSAAGTYQVVLTVTGACGTDEITQDVVIEQEVGNENPFPGVTITTSSGLFLGVEQVDGVNGGPGDWVAAYDEDGNIAGANEIIMSGDVAYIALTIYGDDTNTPEDEGIGGDEGFTLQLFDASENEYLTYPNADNPTVFDEWQSTNGAPMPAYSDFNEIYNWVTSCTDIISLTTGWNLISFDVQPSDSSITSVFSELIANGSLVVISTLTPTGSLFYQPSLPFATLNDITRGWAYWVKVNADVTLTITGTCVDPNHRKSLLPGWNMMGYVPNQAQNITDYFSTELSLGILEYVTGFYSSGSVFFSASLPPFLNTLNQLENGYGYFVRLSTNQPLIGDNTDDKVATSFIYTGLTADLNYHRFSRETLSLRDESGQYIVNVVVNEKGWLAPVTIYGDDETTAELEGLPLSTILQLYDGEMPISKPFEFKGQPGLMTLELNETLVPSITEVNIYPNPTDDLINISGTTDVEVINCLVVDLYGRVIYEKMLPSQNAIHHQLSTRQWVPGIYQLALFDLKGRLILSQTFSVIH